MSFRSWLVKQKDGRFGWISTEIPSDPDFPETFESFRHLEKYVRGGCFRWGADDAVVQCFADAWLEYHENHPRRKVPPKAWCSEICNEEIKLGTGVVIFTGLHGGFHVCHDACKEAFVSSGYEIEDEISLDHAYLKGLRPVHDFQQKNKAILPKNLVSLLRLWDFRFRSEDDQEGLVYFVQAGEGGPIKIGYTSFSVEKRIATLQTAQPERLRLLATVEGGRNEVFLHDYFSKHRKNGEWFEPHSDILQFLATSSLCIK